MKSLTLLTCLSLFSTLLNAQEPLTPRGDKYFFLGINITKVNVRDEAHSPQLYSGWSPVLRIGYERIGQATVSRFAVSYAMGTLTPHARPKPKKQLSSADLTGIQFHYAYYRRVNGFDTEGWNRYVGGSICINADIRQYSLPANNLLGYQFNTSLNGGVFIHKKLGNEAWRFNYEAFIPVISYGIRPNYIGMPPMSSSGGNGGNSVKKGLKQGKIVTFNKLFRFYNRFSFDQQINDHRERRIAYYWDYHVNHISKPLNSITSGLTYESLFKM